MNKLSADGRERERKGERTMYDAGQEMYPSFFFPRQTGEGKVKPRAVDNFGESREEMGETS